MIRRRLNGASFFIEETRGLGQQAAALEGRWTWKADGTTRIVNSVKKKRSDANDSGHRDNQDAEIQSVAGMPGAILSVLTSWAILPFHYLSKRGNTLLRRSLPMRPARCRVAIERTKPLHRCSLRVIWSAWTEEARLRRNRHARRSLAISPACCRRMRAPVRHSGRRNSSRRGGSLPRAGQGLVLHDTSDCSS